MIARATPQVSRRRFLSISAAAAGAGLAPGIALAAAGPSLHRWRGIALGAAAEIRLFHFNAELANDLLRKAVAEVRRLEAIFSLYRPDSSLSQLNRDGRLAAPPLDLVELLALAGRINAATAGAFDPTIQPLWALHAAHYTADPKANRGPSDAAIAETLCRTGWDKLAASPDEIRFTVPGMALTLNGVAQGFVTDRVAALLRIHGMTDVLVDLGEISAIGIEVPTQEGWRIRLDPAHSGRGELVMLRDRAVASSAATGTAFGGAPLAGHILDPRSGRPGASDVVGVSVIAPSAALADALSTAAVITGQDGLTAALTSFGDVAARCIAPDGTVYWIGRIG